MGFKTDFTPLPEHDTSPDIARVLDELKSVGMPIEGQVEDLTNIDRTGDCWYVDC